jgi:hypothetical protein
MKRQVPFSPDTWEGLERRAEACSEAGSKLGPGQMAAFLLEEAISAPPPQNVEDEHELEDRSDDLSKLTDDPQFDDWSSPAPFFAVAA